jgi:hypothetical protein
MQGVLCCQGAPMRRVCRNEHKTAGYGWGGELHAIESEQTEEAEAGRAVQGVGATTKERFA